MGSGGLSATRLQRMHRVLAGYVERGELPGYVAMIERRGEVYVDCVGYGRDTILRIASMAKPIAAAAAMILVEEGVLRLEDSVDDLLPELAHRKVMRTIDADLGDTVPAVRPITLRDLQSFTLGTGMSFGMPAYPIRAALDRAGLGMGEPRPRADEYMRRLGNLPLMYQPGEVWLYNTGSELIGILVERATNQPFADFLRERIFEPLGMADTAYWVPAAKIDRMPPAYTPAPDGRLELDDEPGSGPYSKPPEFASGSGGLVSTVDDYLAFARMLMAGGTQGGVRILARPSVETMTSDQLSGEQKARTTWRREFFATHGWGFGMQVVTRRQDVASTPGQYGWNGGHGTTWRSDPREKMITILGTQVGMTSPDPPRVFRDFLTLAYSAIDD